MNESDLAALSDRLQTIMMIQDRELRTPRRESFQIGAPRGIGSGGPHRVFVFAQGLPLPPMLELVGWGEGRTPGEAVLDWLSQERPGTRTWLDQHLPHAVSLTILVFWHPSNRESNLRVFDVRYEIMEG